MEITEAFSPVRAIAHGFAALRRAPLSVLVGGFALFLVGLCSGGGGGGDFGEIMKEDQPPEVSLAILLVLLGVLAVSIVVALLGFVARSFLLPGWIRLQRHVLEHGTENLALLFSGGDTVVRMMGWRILDGFIRFGTFVVAAIPGAILVALAARDDMNSTLLFAGIAVVALLALPVSIYVGLGLRLGDHAVTLEGLGPIAALDRSWELARGNRLRFWLFFFITDFVSLLGLLLCFIGIFVTRAIADVGVTEAFVLATMPDAKDWTIPREEGL